VATNLQLVRWGDSLRPYGLGCALLLLLCAVSLVPLPATVGKVKCVHTNLDVVAARVSDHCLIGFETVPLCVVEGWKNANDDLDLR